MQYVDILPISDGILDEEFLEEMNLKESDLQVLKLNNSYVDCIHVGYDHWQIDLSKCFDNYQDFINFFSSKNNYQIVNYKFLLCKNDFEDVCDYDEVKNGIFFWVLDKNTGRTFELRVNSISDKELIEVKNILSEAKEFMIEHFKSFIDNVKVEKFFWNGDYNLSKNYMSISFDSFEDFQKEFTLDFPDEYNDLVTYKIKDDLLNFILIHPSRGCEQAVSIKINKNDESSIKELFAKVIKRIELNFENL